MSKAENLKEILDNICFGDIGKKEKIFAYVNELKGSVPKTIYLLNLIDKFFVTLSEEH